jgi:hypothetical protein
MRESSVKSERDRERERERERAGKTMMIVKMYACQRKKKCVLSSFHKPFHLSHLMIPLFLFSTSLSLHIQRKNRERESKRQQRQQQEWKKL